MVPKVFLKYTIGKGASLAVGNLKTWLAPDTIFLIAQHCASTRVSHFQAARSTEAASSIATEAIP